ncbi:hypothetical protein PR048_033622 [Dryococelus australis]|uniref:Uncharacterized protein n=1 Tax=Dryococelus australis TaxID=614101 RepID=A0ABQ9G411_9NEOP|nr:hypothetical protein PR048_033622 [Dryococelus australis]
MPFVGGGGGGSLSEISRVSPALSFRRCSTLTSITLIGSQDLDVQSRPNLFTLSPVLHGGWCRKFPSYEAENCGTNKGDTATPIKCAIASTRRALNWRAVFSSHCAYLWDFQRRHYTCIKLLIKAVRVSDNAYDLEDTARGLQFLSSCGSKSRSIAQSFRCFFTLCMGRGGRAVSSLASHQGESSAGSLSGFSHVGIVPDGAVGRRVFSGISRSPRPFIPAPLHTHLTHPSSPLKTCSQGRPNLFTHSHFVELTFEKSPHILTRAFKSAYFTVNSPYIEWHTNPARCPFGVILCTRLRAAPTWSNKDDNDTRASCPFAPTCKALNWRAEFPLCCMYLWDFKGSFVVCQQWRVPAREREKGRRRDEVEEGKERVLVVAGKPFSLYRGTCACVCAWARVGSAKFGILKACGEANIARVVGSASIHRCFVSGKLNAERAPGVSGSLPRLLEVVVEGKIAVPPNLRRGRQSPRDTSPVSITCNGAAVAELLARSPPTKANRIFASGNRDVRCRWSAGLLGDLPFPPPLHSGAAPHSLQSPSSALKTSLLRDAQISSLR